ncbi:MAG TPA: rod shape-determining protein [Gaiellaceae bacterium]|nr:rod shape-determining protein [Gaiellaceae bacterium]
MDSLARPLPKLGRIAGRVGPRGGEDRRAGTFRARSDSRLLSRLLGGIGGSLAVDLGTANTVVFVQGEGIVLFEPSVIAVDDETNEVLAVGEQAREMIGRTPASIRATRPLRHGVIADFDVTEQMLRHFIRKAIGKRGLRRPRVVLCVPSGLTGVERDAVEDATLAAGASAVSLIEEAMAAAIGAGLPVAEPVGSMVVDVGGGTTEVAITSLGALAVSDSLRVGGYEMDDAIVRHAKNRHRLLVGGDAAEQVKLAIGSAWPLAEDEEAEIRGRDFGTGTLRRASLTGAEVREALDGTVGQILAATKGALEQAPAELAADVMQRGLVLVGGGTLLRGLDERLRNETGLTVMTAESPLTCVAIGAGLSLEEPPVRATSRRRRAVPRATAFRRRW